MPCRWRIATLLGVITVPLVANAFNFTNSNPTECDDITIKWTGGEPPFRLLIIPPGWPVKNISIPSTAYQAADKSGTYIMQLPLPQTQPVMFSISDATGITAGGISPLLIVGDSVSGAQCNTTFTKADFWYSLDSDLEECKLYPFTQYPDAVQPVTIYGFVPSGQSFTLHPPVGDSFQWMNNDLTAGTSVTFSMIDSQGRDGGTSNMRVVKSSDDKSCLSSASSPPASSSSTSSSSASSSSSSGSSTLRSSSPTSSSSSTGGSTGGSTTPSSKSNTGIIAGSAVGGLILASLFIFLAAFCLRRRGGILRKSIKKSHEEIDLLDPFAGFPHDDAYSPPPTAAITPFERELYIAPISRKAQIIQSTENEAFLTPSPGQRVAQFSKNSRNSMRPDAHHIPLVPVGSSQNRDDYSSRVEPPGQRVIVHTDIAENMDEPLELPPQYAAGRPPISGLYPSGG